MSFLPGQFAHPYEINPSYRTSDAYFSMECGIEFEVTVHDHPVLVRALYLLCGNLRHCAPVPAHH